MGLPFAVLGFRQPKQLHNSCPPDVSWVVFRVPVN